MPARRPTCEWLGGLAAAWIGATPVHAQAADGLAALRAEIAALKAEQATAARRIAQLEQALDAKSAPSPTVTTAATAPAPPVPVAPINPAGGSAPGALPAATANTLALNGDLRLRYEDNFGDRDARDRGRLVMRGRLRAAYPINRWLTIGGQLSTGDPGDPNSTDVTLTGFDNDLTVSLDQAYLRASFGELTLNGGKFAQPFARTEMVWDGDVDIQGIAATYRAALGKTSTLRAHGLYMIVDEAAAAADSYMVGGQLQFETTVGPLRLALAGGYYDYTLKSVAGADAGDIRTNRFAGGRYLSDFDLLDVIGGVTYDGWGAKWPIRLVGDYVRNFGATTDQATGFGIDLILGRGNRHRDWRFGYGYAQTGVDAVLAAFSHDNTDLATNYRQHTLFAEYMVVPHVLLNATYYRYRPKSRLFTTGVLPDDWTSRLRLNMLVSF